MTFNVRAETMIKYEDTVSGEFISRPNRFIAKVLIDGAEETVHVKNTGRLGELLLPGAKVTLQRTDEAKRKTKYDLISVYRGGLGWVNIDSQVPNRLVRDWLMQQGFDLVKPEYAYGDSRIDFYMERGDEKWLLEVKGCTLERGGLGWFPDAVSDRAARHERELEQAAKSGWHAATAFVIAMEGVDDVLPNTEKDPKFAAAFAKAAASGVRQWNFLCGVIADAIWIKDVRIK